MRIAWEGRELYCHISTKAGFDPVKTLYVCAPGADAASYEAAARFAQASGWREIADLEKLVLRCKGTNKKRNGSECFPK